MDGLEIDWRPLSPHRQIAAWLRKRIEAGEFPPGKRLPSENDIQQLTGVAATTVRRAIALLREQGIVYTVPGRGTYADSRPTRPDRPAAPRLANTTQVWRVRTSSRPSPPARTVVSAAVLQVAVSPAHRPPPCPPFVPCCPSLPDLAHLPCHHDP